MISAVLIGLLVRDLPTGPLNLLGGVGINGKPISIDWSKSKATVLFFIATDCPIANRYAPEIARIAKAYGSKGVQSYRVYVSGKAKEIATHGKEYSLNMPAILDTRRKLVTSTGVKVSPEAVVLNSQGIVVYRGRIDDQNIDHGSIRKDFRRDLRVALDETLAGKSVSVREATAIGCYL
jgi:thiol-disulfide isomerase/thioredoxin